MHNHSVVIAGGGPTGLMLAGELALAGVDVAVVERRQRLACVTKRSQADADVESGNHCAERRSPT